MPNKKYEIAIIGAGTAGLTARKQVANATDSYVVIDDGVLGTTCARVGCMPSKVFIQVANDFHRRQQFASLGIEGSQTLTINYQQVMQHVRKLRDRFVRSVLADIDEWKNKHLIPKRARFIDRHTLDLGDESIHADKIIIATGSKPVIPKEWQKYHPYLIDTDAFFELKDFPKTMAVIGLGIIGIELGQALHRIGVDVTAIGRGKSVGGLTDPELCEYTSSELSKEMQVDYSGVQSLHVESGKLVIKTEAHQYSVDKALIAVGRRPIIDELDLKNISVKLNKDGIPDFDVNTSQVKDTSIFIAGDTNGVRPLLHEGADDGTIAGYNAVASSPIAFRRRTYLSITFSAPNIAIIGQSYQQLQNQSIEFAIGEVSFEGQGRAIVMLQEQGLLRIYACRKSNKLLGAELFCPAGEHLAHLIAFWITKEMTVEECLSLPFYHPVLEEGLRTALKRLSYKLNNNRVETDLSICADHPTNAC